MIDFNENNALGILPTDCFFDVAYKKEVHLNAMSNDGHSALLAITRICKLVQGYKISTREMLSR